MVKIFVSETTRLPLSGSIQNNAHKRNHWVGGLLLSYALDNCFNIRPDYLNVASNEYGKPFLVDYPHLCFNLSHSGDWVTCIVGNSEVGIDVEQIRKVEGIEKISQAMFSVGEQERLKGLGGPELLNQFFSLWTLKESYIKYLGMGFSRPFNSFSVTGNSTGYKLEGTEDDNSLNLELFECLPGHLLAVCSHQKVSLEDISVIHSHELASFELEFGESITWEKKACLKY